MDAPIPPAAGRPPVGALPIVAPPRVSGLALLGGVFLSTGQVKSAGSLHLIVTIVGLILLVGVSSSLAFLVVWLLEQLGVAGSVPLTALFVAGAPAAGNDWWVALIAVVRVVCFLAVLRFTPLAGYHAAEHKVVNAMERVGSLDPEVVRRMPRQHPRCGTNLFPVIAPLMLWFVIGSPVSPVLFLALVAFGFWLRHPLGYALQTVFTTREPSERQLRAGIASGQRLLSLWSTTPPRRLSTAAGMWQRGLPQAVIGVVIGLQVAHWADHLLLRLWGWGL